MVDRSNADALRFPTTQHSAVIGLRTGSAESRTRAWQLIVAAYWRPAYKHLRVRRGIAREPAEDIVQSFFTAAFEEGFLDRFDAARGAFRTFLRTCLDRHAASHQRSERRLKRGGGLPHVPIDTETFEAELARISTQNATTGDVFDEEFRRVILGESIAELRERLRRERKQVVLMAFEAYDLASEPRPTYAALARDLGIPTTTVTNHLAAARRLLRAIAIERLRVLTSTDRELRAEIDDLFARGGA